MIRYTEGNLLEADAEALVNTVNTVGVMGKGIALMFKEAFPDSFRAYAAACKRGEVQVGKMFVTTGPALRGPRWIIHFPTKKHWRHRTQKEWVRDGLVDLRQVIAERNIRSIAIPPLGCGNGGLDWATVRPMIEEALDDLPEVEVLVYQPTSKYQNVAKARGVEKLTPARALIAELVRRYSILGLGCSLLEIQKLAWFAERAIIARNLANRLDLRFSAKRYGPYSDRLRHLLDGLDGSYLRSVKRISDAKAADPITFNDRKKARVDLYLRSEAKPYLEPLETVTRLIDGFESPLGMEALASVDWLLEREGCSRELKAVKDGLEQWPGGTQAGARKLRIFDDHLLELVLERLATVQLQAN